MLQSAGCNWNAFDSYERTAPIRVHARPSNFEQPEYGLQLASLQADGSGAASSYLFASAGPATPIAIMRAWNGRKVSESDAQLRCHAAGECPGGSDIGASLIPFATWAASSPTPRKNCVFAPSNSLFPWQPTTDPRLGGEAFVLCEGESTIHFAMSEAFLDARGDDGSMKFSGFGLPSGHPLGVVIYGAYALDNRTGERRGGGLYLQQDVNVATSAAPLALPVPLIEPESQQLLTDDRAVGDLGAQVVGSFDASGVLVLAVSQPSQQRVLVASWDPSLPGMPIDKFRLRACLRAPDSRLTRFGDRLVMGDITGDGHAELFVGSEPLDSAGPGSPAVYMYRAEGLPAAPVQGETCPGWKQAAVPVACADAGGLLCASSGFGSSLAVGDVDADGKGDLIVGAPLTQVDGANEAGAVWLIPGSADGLDLARTSVLEAGKHANAHLGAAVTALHTQGRDEPVASAPGQADVYVFMCSPLEPGFGAKSLCLPD